MTKALYLVCHFTNEERMMEKARFPGFEPHLLLHRRFAKRTDAVTYSHSETDSACEVLDFLKDSWSNHINWEGRKYAPVV